MYIARRSEKSCSEVLSGAALGAAEVPVGSAGGVGAHPPTVRFLRPGVIGQEP